MKTIPSISLALILTGAPLFADAGAPSRQPVAVFNFEAVGAPPSEGARFARILSIDLSLLPPVDSIPGPKLAAVASPPSFGGNESVAPDAIRELGRSLGAAALVNGKVVLGEAQATVVAKVVDAATGRVYGEMVQAERFASLNQLAAELSPKIAALVLQVRGLAAANWPAATILPFPDADVTVDGLPVGANGAVAPGLHAVEVGCFHNDSSIRARFFLEAGPGGAYRIVVRDEADRRARLWIADAGSSAPVTTSVERVWMPGKDVPLALTATYLLPGPRDGMAAVADSGAIYVIGGSYAGGPLGEIVRFDLRSHRCTTLTRSILPRCFLGAVLLDGQIYILGGSGMRARLRSVQVFHLATGRMTEGPPMPTPRRSFGAVAAGSRIYVLGGTIVPPSSTDRVDFLDLATGQWAAGPAMPRGLTGHAVLAGDRIVFPGGFQGDLRVVGTPGERDRGDTRMVQALNWRDGTWGFLPPLPEPMSGTAMAVLDGRLYLLGSYWDPDRALAYDLSTGLSTRFNIEGTGRRNSIAVAVGRSIYVIGGLIPGMGRSNRIDVFEENPNWASDATQGLPLR